MIRVYKLLVILLMSFSITKAEPHLSLINQTTFPIENQSGYFVEALLLGNDSLLLANKDGIWLHKLGSSDWKIALECDEKHEYESVYRLNKLNACPRKIIKYNHKIIFLDFHQHYPFLLARDKSDSYHAELWKDGINLRQDKEYYKNIIVSNNFILYGISLTSAYDQAERAAILQRTDKKPDKYCKDILTVPASLKSSLDSVGAVNAYTIPAFNPHDSTIWILIEGYDYIFISDTLGNMLDSVKIYGSDFKSPPVPISWIPTSSVDREWENKWTQPDCFTYVSPGYFLFCYRVANKDCGNNRTFSRSYIAWDHTGKAVDIEIDGRWRIVGVDPGGEIIFASYDCANNPDELKLSIMRIVE